MLAFPMPVSTDTNLYYKQLNYQMRMIVMSWQQPDSAVLM